MAPLEGQYILIIGGSSGMGFAVAKLALASGAKVAIASSSADKVQDAVSRLSGGGGHAQASGHVVTTTRDGIQQQQQPLDHVINTAGRGVPKPISEIDMGSVNELARLPLFVPLLIGKLAPRFLKAGPNSSIIFASGQVAEKPASPEEVAEAYIYLVKNTDATGSNVSSNGGVILK
ncbi:NAD(P)-binding protein [Apiospora phragmitis]|uniref:NAD(P)-binding protein n=1 Tax=Apiospora phragmitis TaxID=2905665 RepID=A0ABR1WT14_9PEZI